MKYLIASPPAITPSEPPSGAFLLASALKARGIEAGFADLSLEFYRHVFSKVPSGKGYPAVGKALEYLRVNPSYDPSQHRSASGTLSSALKDYSRRFPGWKITLMDVTPPSPVHRPSEILNICRNGTTPFTSFWEEYLEPILDSCKPETILVSLSYLSQLAAGIDLVHFLQLRGCHVIAGGSLLNSLSRTGLGIELISNVLPDIILGDGSALLGEEGSGDGMLSDLVWPEMISSWTYISGRPVVPYALSTGCYWNKCLFCPDRDSDFSIFGKNTLEKYVTSIPQEILDDNPVIHFIDSAVPRAAITEVLQPLTSLNLDFYGFARPEEWIIESADSLAEAGCLMLQFGVESGSRSLLERFCKGISPETSLTVLRRCSEAGIRTYAYMLLGLPGETESDLEQTEKLLREAGDSIDFLNFSIFNLPRFCELAERADEFDIELLDFDMPDDAIRLYSPFLHRGHNPRVGARNFTSDRLKAIPSVGKALLRTPRWFRTSHFPLLDILGRITTKKASGSSNNQCG